MSENYNEEKLEAAISPEVKEHCFQWRYDIKRYTDNYTDTVSFELSEDCDAFQEWYQERYDG